VEVSVMLESTPTLNVALDGEVITVGWSTMRANDCDDAGATPLLAVTVIG
jgi:hypothetical protein